MSIEISSTIEKGPPWVINGLLEEVLLVLVCDLDTAHLSSLTCTHTQRQTAAHKGQSLPQSNHVSRLTVFVYTVSQLLVASEGGQGFVTLGRVIYS